ncbi:hypothetical protein FQN60_005500, partial [Etheostoma spectabile]
MEATDGGSSWIGDSSRSSMRGFLMFDSGLVRGVTLFRLIKVPGPFFISCRSIKHYLRSVSVGVHRLHIQRDGLHFAPVGDRGELQHRVEGTLQEVGQQAAHDSLVADDQDVLLPLQVHDDWLHPLDQVLVRLCWYLFAPRREACVPTQPALHVVGALSVPTQVDGAWLDVDVHQVVDNLALDVILDPVDEEAPTHVYHLDEREIPGGRTEWGERLM